MSEIKKKSWKEVIDRTKATEGWTVENGPILHDPRLLVFWMTSLENDLQTLEKVSNLYGVSITP